MLRYIVYTIIKLECDYYNHSAYYHRFTWSCFRYRWEAETEPLQEQKSVPKKSLLVMNTRKHLRLQYFVIIAFSIMEENISDTGYIHTIYVPSISCLSICFLIQCLFVLLLFS